MIFQFRPVTSSGQNVVHTPFQILQSVLRSLCVGLLFTASAMAQNQPVPGVNIFWSETDITDGDRTVGANEHGTVQRGTVIRGPVFVNAGPTGSAWVTLGGEYFDFISPIIEIQFGETVYIDDLGTADFTGITPADFIECHPDLGRYTLSTA